MPLKISADYNKKTTEPSPVVFINLLKLVNYFS